MNLDTDITQLIQELSIPFGMILLMEKKFTKDLLESINLWQIFELKSD